MPKLSSFTLKIKTGRQGRSDVPQYAINGFTLDFDNASGSMQTGETLEATGTPESFPHSLTLIGPPEGGWDIEGIEASYQCVGEEPYTVRLGALTLDDQSDLNIWHQRPERMIDV